jgi:hypothetical protein
MRSNLLPALILTAISPFISAQTSNSVAPRVAAQNALFDEASQANLKMNPSPGFRCENR